MPSSYDNPIKFEEQATGENNNTWGDKLIQNCLELITEAYGGFVEQAITTGTTALTLPNGTSSTGRHFAIKLTGTLTGNVTVTVPADVEKPWAFWNAATVGTYTVKVKGASGSNEITIPAGAIVFLTSEGSAGSGEVREIMNHTLILGEQEMWIPAGSMIELTTNGANGLNQTELTAGRPELATFDFDASTKEYVQFDVAMPKSWDGGVVQARFYWTANSTSTNNVIWGISGVSLSDDDAVATSYGTEVTVTDANKATQNDMNISDYSGDITIAGSPAVGDLTYFKVSRDAADAGDDLAVDAKLIGVMLKYTTDKRNDA